MAKVGGARPGAGRPKGSVSKAKRDLAELAKSYTDVALQALASIAKSGESEMARCYAATALLDRAYGKPRQAIEHSGEGGGPLVINITGPDADL